MLRYRCGTQGIVYFLEGEIANLAWQKLAKHYMWSAKFHEKIASYLGNAVLERTLCIKFILLTCFLENFTMALKESEVIGMFNH